MKKLVLSFVFAAMPLHTFAMEKNNNPTEEQQLYHLLVKATLDNNIPAIQKLIDQNVNIIDFEPHYYLPILHFASVRRKISQKTFMFLVKNSSNIDNVHDIHSTPLYKAIVENNIDKVKCLVENGSDIYKDLGEGKTPYTVAFAEASTMYAKIMCRSKIVLAQYLEYVQNYNTMGIMEPLTKENESTLPDYLALAVLKQRTCDIQILYDINDTETVPYMPYYIKLARKRNKPLSLHELAFIKTAQPHNTKTYAEEYCVDFQKKLFALKNRDTSKSSHLACFTFE